MGCCRILMPYRSCGIEKTLLDGVDDPDACCSSFVASMSTSFRIPEMDTRSVTCGAIFIEWLVLIFVAADMNWLLDEFRSMKVLSWDATCG